MLIRLITTILILTSFIKTELSAEIIKETREKISHINISFLKSSYPDKSMVKELGNLLSNLENNKKFPSINMSEKDSENKFQKLLKSYTAFENFFHTKPEVDTLKKMFRVANNEFNSQYGKYFLGELKKSTKQKIILLSTSMSCECTLEMCYKQESEIQKLQLEQPELFDYAVVDCFTNSEIQSKYEVGFIPSLIIQDPNGKEVKRIVRSEKLLRELEKHFGKRID